MITSIKKFLLSLILALCFSGCTKNSVSRENKTLVIGSIKDIINVDPQVVSNITEIKILSAVFEGLLVPEPKTYNPMPGVAEKWNISEDGKVYEFYLRKDARWSNGDFVTADDFVFSAKRALSSRLGCSFIEMFFPLKNAKKFYDREIRDFNKVGISAINKHTLRIELENPCGSFIYFIMQPCWYPLNKMVCESLKNFGEFSEVWNDVYPNIISNGPFIISSYQSGKNVVLEKNPYYWDYDNLKIDNIQWVVDNDSEILKMFQENTIDVIPYNVVDTISGSETVNDIANSIDEKEIKISPCFGCCFFYLNTSVVPLNDRNVRIALAVGINREKLLTLLPRDVLSAAYGLIPTLFDEYKADPLFNEDLNYARELLKRSGYPNGENFPRLRLICNNRQKYRVIAEFLKKELKDNLNIEIDIEYQQWDRFLSERKQGNFDISFGEWFGDYPDPITFLSLFSGLSQQNYCKWNNSEYDNLLKTASNSYDLQVRLQILKHAESFLINNMPIIPLYFESNIVLMKDRVLGWDINLMDVYPWKFINFKKR